MKRLVRNYRPEDFEAVRQLHEASGIDYRMPELKSPLWIVNKVLEVDGQVKAALALRIEAETFLWCGGTPREKMDAMQALQPEVLAAAWGMGIDNLVCWVPAEVEKRFSKRLTQLGWKRGREGWHSWSRETETEGQAG